MKSVRLAWAVTIAAAAMNGIASAQPDRWQSYSDPAFGTRIVYPPDLFPTASRTRTGTAFTGPDATLEVSARVIPGIDSLADLRRLIAATPGYESITYSPQGQSWLVVSGYREGDVYYEKFFLVGNTVQGFSVQYPKARRSLYDPVVERLEDSFRAGRHS